MAHDDLWVLVNSNARSIQALTEALETSRLQAEEDRLRADRERQEFREAMQLFAVRTAGMANLLVSLDSDRPMLLRKLDSIEGKVDAIAERLEEE